MLCLERVAPRPRTIAVLGLVDVPRWNERKESRNVAARVGRLRHWSGLKLTGDCGVDPLQYLDPPASLNEMSYMELVSSRKTPLALQIADYSGFLEGSVRTAHVHAAVARVTHVSAH